jgi:hypothetical protein
MTRSEYDFYTHLQELFGDRFLIFPQVHISAIIDHKVKGQSWRKAFFNINGKSVDYVFCDKEHVEPILAIELDDPSHKWRRRVRRDQEVEQMFREANLPLFRFRDYKNFSSEDIFNKITPSLKRI